MKHELTLDFPAVYRIEVQGYLEDHWSEWFDGLSIDAIVDPKLGSSTTTLTGRIVDQAALHGILRKLYDLGMPILLVECEQQEKDKE